MRQVAGASVILAVAVAAMRFAGGPQNDTPHAGKAEKAQSQPVSTKGSVAKSGASYQGGCTVFDPQMKVPARKDPQYPKDANLGVARAIIDRFFRVEETASSSPSPIKAISGVRYAIALAPDPRHTNLSLMFDREMVAIQQSAQDEGYSYNSSWLPWKTEASAYPLYADAQRSEDETDEREACPGFLLFRKSVKDLKPDPDPKAWKTHPYSDAADPPDAYAQALVVFVVGEQPTGGLNESQWANAIAWLNKNASPDEGLPGPGKNPRALYLLGPTFSGSLVSLDRDLADPKLMQDDKSLFPSRLTQVRILSGSISSCSSTRWFQQRIAQTRPATTLFGSFHENDDLHIFRFLNYLDQQGTDPKDIAILSEDETAYAATPVASAPQAKSQPPQKNTPPPAACEFPYDRAKMPVRFSYPRDISAVRAAYEKESVFSTGSARGAHPILQESDTLAEGPSSASDTIRSYGGAITPIAQEAVLYGLVSHLRSHHSQYLILRCTNPLDFLFLTRFFHRAYPEGRIVTVGSDLLFRREIDSTEFRGVLALSNYPLLPRDQHWAALSTLDPNGPYPPHTHRIPDSHMEGMYLAARYLFGDDVVWPTPPGGVSQPLTLRFKPNLPDFADPFWMHNPGEPLTKIQAPTWLSVVGRDGYWPLAVLNETSTPKSCLDKPDRLDRQSVSDCPVLAHAAPPTTLVRLSGSVTESKKSDSKKLDIAESVHYDLDPIHLNRFYPTLLLKMHLAWQICAVCATFLVFYQAFGVWRGPKLTSSGLFALFRPVPARSQSILLGINCALAALLPFELLTLGTALPAFDRVLGQGHLLAVTALIWLVWFVAIYLVMFLLPPETRGSASIIALAVLALAMMWQLYAGFRGHASAVAANLNSFSDLFAGTNNFAFFLPCWALSMAAILSRLFPVKSPRNLWATAFFIVTLVFGGFLLVSAIHSRLNTANDLPLFYRISHLTSGVSPMMPILFLLAGFYLWTWQGLAGNAFLCYGHPLLPILSKARYRVSREMGKSIVKIASPLFLGPQITLLPICLLIAAVVYMHGQGPPLVSLEGSTYDHLLNGALLFAFLITIAESARLFFTWKELQRMLMALSRLRLRRTFARLRAIESSTLWSVSGNVQRVQYQFFSQQIDAAKRLDNLSAGDLPAIQSAAVLGDRFAVNSADKLSTGPLWEKSLLADGVKPELYIRDVLNDAAAEALNNLELCWSEETGSLSLDGKPLHARDGEGVRDSMDMELSDNLKVRAAEEFVCFHYIAFIQNILARMRTMILSMGFLFVSVCLAISFYPFVPRTGIGIWMLVNLVFIAASVVYVYAGMERDATLSYITNTRPGNLGTEFYIKTATFLAGPVIGLLTTQFPAISESVLGWLQPGLDALK